MKAALRPGVPAQSRGDAPTLLSDGRRRVKRRERTSGHQRPRRPNQSSARSLPGRCRRDYAFNSRLSSSTKRQSVPSARSALGLWPEHPQSRGGGARRTASRPRDRTRATGRRYLVDGLQRVVVALRKPMPSTSCRAALAARPYRRRPPCRWRAESAWSRSDESRIQSRLPRSYSRNNATRAGRACVEDHPIDLRARSSWDSGGKPKRPPSHPRRTSPSRLGRLPDPFDVLLRVEPDIRRHDRR